MDSVRNWNFLVLCALAYFLIATSNMINDYSIDHMPIRNGRGEQCSFTATESGRYKLSGAARRPWHQLYCSLFIRGPPHSRIRLTFNRVQLDCDKSILNVYDGWRVFDWLKKKHYSLPEDTFEEDAKNNRRQFDLCNTPKARDSVDPISIETSQNAGQIFYRFVRQDSVIVTVDFIEDTQLCNVIVGDTLDNLYTISNRGTAGVCKWYISGAVAMSLVDVHLLNSTGQQSSSLSWRNTDVKLEQRFCDIEKEKVDHLLPCKFNRLELHTDDLGVEQWVTFSLARPSEIEKEPYTYYCY